MNYPLRDCEILFLGALCLVNIFHYKIPKRSAGVVRQAVMYLFRLIVTVPYATHIFRCATHKPTVFRIGGCTCFTETFNITDFIIATCARSHNSLQKLIHNARTVFTESLFFCCFRLFFDKDIAF